MTDHTPTDDLPPATDDLRCQRVRLLLSLSVDDSATPSQQAEIDAHLPGCGECRAAGAADRAVRARLAEPASVPSGFRERVLAAATRRVREARAQNRLLMAGAAAAVLLAAFSLFSQSPAADRRPGPDAVAVRDGRAMARTALITRAAADRVPAAAEERPR